MALQHPTTPPPELVGQWQDESPEMQIADHVQYLIARAAQWGANQELEACCEWLGDAPVVYNDNGDLHPGSYLRDARRPKPPSLKAQAQVELDRLIALIPSEGALAMAEPIRRALEALDD
jgi:hypothetical protein